QKADQIALHIYTKLFHVLYQARASPDSPLLTTTTTDRWFNLETPDSDLFPRELRELYKAISTTFPAPPPTLYISVLLAVPELSNNHVLVALAQSQQQQQSQPGSSSRIRIEPTPRYVLLESWSMTFTSRPKDVPPPTDVALPTIYKHGIPLFRSLFSLLRILPAWK
ncbi:hypothetical protein AMATHDRAFT_132443, partial [Amanita thiersii Skay4041]